MSDTLDRSIENEYYDFDSLDHRDIPFKYQGVNYVLREASEGAAKTFNNARTSKIMFDANGKPVSLRDAGDLRPLLLSLCCEYADGKKQGQNVPKTEVEKWPARMGAKLFDDAKRISDLDEKDPVQRELEEALERPDSPVKLADLRMWIESLGDEYRRLKASFKADAEELAKNGQPATPTGSG